MEGVLSKKPPRLVIICCNKKIVEFNKINNKKFKTLALSKKTLDHIQKKHLGPPKKLDPLVKFFLFIAMVVISALVEGVSVSRIQNFFKNIVMFRPNYNLHLGILGMPEQNKNETDCCNVLKDC